MRDRFILCLLCLSFLQVAFAQNNDTRFNSGKTFMAQEKYLPAMESFKPLLSESKDNKYVKDAHYFYGLCALKSGKTEEARQIVKQLLLKYPSWEKINEANYLLANILFEQGTYKDALETLESVGVSMQKDADKLKSFYLAKMDNMESLKWLQQIYPKDRELAKALASKLSKMSLNDKDKMLYNYLVEEFKLEREKAPSKVVIKKSSYNVAVLFPFMVNKLAVENVGRSNQFILDMYQGMRIAVDSLKKQGVTINLLAYDTEKEVEKFTKLLQEPELKKMDLIIGPVYPAHLSLLADFAEKHNIVTFSPFLFDANKTADKNSFFLYQPSYTDQGEQLASYVLKNLKHSNNKATDSENKIKKNEIVVIYGSSEKDSIIAFSYRKSLTKVTGNAKSDTTLYLRSFEMLKREGVGKIKTILGDSSKMEKLNHIVVISSDQVIAANIISATEIMGFDIPIFTTSDWLDFNLITIDQFERRKVHFIYPDYIDYSKPVLVNFKDKYLSETHLYPSTFAYQGYDMMLFLGKELYSYGNDFDQDLKKTGFISGTILPGYNYKDSQSNQFVPIVKFVSGKLELVNYPIEKE